MRAVDVLEVRVMGPANFKSLRSFASQTLQRASQRRKQPRELVDAAKQLRTQLQSLGLAPHGPHWYGGDALANERFERDRIAAVLERLEAETIMVGHDRAFPSSGEATPMTSCSPMPPDPVSGLMMLDREELRTHLGNYLSNAQMDALLERRDRVLAVCNPSSK